MPIWFQIRQSKLIFIRKVITQINQSIKLIMTTIKKHQKPIRFIQNHIRINLHWKLTWNSYPAMIKRSQVYPQITVSFPTPIFIRTVTDLTMRDRVSLWPTKLFSRMTKQSFLHRWRNLTIQLWWTRLKQPIQATRAPTILIPFQITIEPIYNKRWKLIFATLNRSRSRGLQKRNHLQFLQRY